MSTVVSISSLHATVKRALDFVVALLLLLALLPIFALIVILIELESLGSPFYRATRVGYRGKTLRLLKFRKMHVDAAGLPITLDGDPRLTRVGAFLTRTRIDELPQLWHVVRGQMSLVGPRPEDPLFVERHRPEYERILSVRPGITGWSQLAYATEREILDPVDPIGHYVSAILPAKVRIDCQYAERTSVWRDLQVLWWTLLAMLAGMQVAVHRETGRLSRRRPRSRSGFVVRPPAPTDLSAMTASPAGSARHGAAHRRRG